MSETSHNDCALTFFIRYIINVRMVILGVIVLLEAFQMSLVFYFAVRLCPMLPDLMTLFQMFCGLCLSFKHLIHFWPSALSLVKQKITAHLSVKFPFVCFWPECGFDCMKKSFADSNFGLFCITVIIRVCCWLSRRVGTCAWGVVRCNRENKTRVIEKKKGK
jgi:hypothetical protein